jgi:hypothetical protein
MRTRQIGGREDIQQWALLSNLRKLALELLQLLQLL